MENLEMAKEAIKWQHEWVEHAKKILAAGGSMGEAANGVNHKFGVRVTRNSMIGKIHRLKADGDFNLPEPEQWKNKSMETFVSYWHSGISSTDIGHYFGVESSTIRDKAYKYGLTPRGTETGWRALKKPVPKTVKVASDGISKRTTFPNPKAKAVLFENLTSRMCRFVIGDKPFYFCGADVELGSPVPYCTHCRKVMYTPSNR
jgi:hypothetical protein